MVNLVLIETLNVFVVKKKIEKYRFTNMFFWPFHMYFHIVFGEKIAKQLSFAFANRVTQ